MQMFNKNDPLIESVTKIMQENQIRRDVEKAVNEELGIYMKRHLPFEMHAAYDALIEEVVQEALSEKLVGNQHKIDVNKNNRLDKQDFKMLRAKKEKKPEEHGVEAEREMAAKGKKMYEETIEEDTMTGITIKTVKHPDPDPNMLKMHKVYYKGKHIGHVDEYKHRASDKHVRFGSHHKDEGDIIGGHRSKEEAIHDIRMAEAGKRKENKNTVKEEKLDEVSPPSAKAERMVKYIKKGYSKDGDLSKKEKSIAYATAWKAYNKSKAKD